VHSVIIIAVHAKEVMFIVQVVQIHCFYITVFAFQTALMQYPTIMGKFQTIHAMHAQQTAINVQVPQDAQIVK
jgi:hypothetical protein